MMDFVTFQEKFPIQLNEQQLEAMQAVDGPVLLLAVPGSGKTTVLVARLGYMIYCKGIQPENILTLTYTVAATRDMRSRFVSYFGQELGDRVEFRTINSISAGIINYYGRMIGKKPYELISDDKLLMGILSGLYQKYQEEFPMESDLKGIRTDITYIKNMMFSPDEIQELEDEAGVHLLEIYNGYCQELKSRNLMDYDDQMVYAYNLLKASPDLLNYYQNRYSYICVDEAQDTSKIQHEIIALLTSRRQNLFMVGDEDQSIYGFRAAYPEALLSFERRYPDAKVLLMEENFRSNGNIVEAADAFIQQNTLRHKKTMRANRPATSEIHEIQLQSRAAQYNYLLKVARNCTQETAVLYRDNESAIPLVDLLERDGIPYRLKNAELNFFTNRVVVDIENILRFAFDPTDTEIFERIYYKMSTYLTKQQMLSACNYARAEDIPVLEAVLLSSDLKPHTRKSIKALQTHLENLRDEEPKRAIHRIVNFMGYKEYMERNDLKDNKILILKAVAGRESTIRDFLNRMSELKELFSTKDSDMDSPFILSTIHSSKGLEYDNVYLIDVANGLFPEEVPFDIREMKPEDRSAFEEERRLFYVGVTRARNELYLFKTLEPSIFIKQLFHPTAPGITSGMSSGQNPGTASGLRRGRYSGNYGEMKTASRPGVRAPQSYFQQVGMEHKKKKFDENEYRRFIESLGEGVILEHKSFGQGVVKELGQNKVTITFDAGDKVFALKTLFQTGAITI